jgi:hypothetical protein|tara:strand:- start:4065 stop:4703 length:639 start_codon:yes stop_codon:yes gene_type:complete
MSAALIAGLLLCFLCSLSSGVIQFTSFVPGTKKHFIKTFNFDELPDLIEKLERDGTSEDVCNEFKLFFEKLSKKIEETEIDIITHEPWDLTGKENVNDVLENETGTSMLKFLQFMGAITEGDACNKDRQESGNFLLDHHTKIKGKVDSSENVDTSCLSLYNGKKYFNKNLQWSTWDSNEKKFIQKDFKKIYNDLANWCGHISPNPSPSPSTS